MQALVLRIAFLFERWIAINGGDRIGLKLQFDVAFVDLGDGGDICVGA